MTHAWSPTGLIPCFSKTKGNTYATLLHHPFLYKRKPTHAQEVARRISGAVAGEIYAMSRHTKYPSQLLSFALHYLPFASRFPLPHFTLAVLFAPFAIRLFFACFLCVCVLDCLSPWLKTILNCVTFPIPTTMIFLALRFLLLPMLNLVKLMLLC